jgi:uncharacterized metal-binding protein YceD (DUF177 family)
VSDDLLWEHKVRFDDAAKGLTLTLIADEARKARLKAAFGMIELPQLTAEVITTGRTAIQPGTNRSVPLVHVQVKLEGEVTQECAVSLEAFTHPISAELELDCLKAQDYVAPEPTGEHELRPEDLDEPDLIEGPLIDLGLYVIEALGEAYDPFARMPGVEFVEPPPAVEPSPFAALGALKLKDTPE